MTAFIIAAAALSALVVGLLLRPLLARRAAGSRGISMGVVLAVPLVAGLVYGVIGNAAALSAQPSVAVDPQIEKMVATLAARLEKNPGDAKGWTMLARSYKVMGRPAEAQRAYEKAGDFIDRDAQELASYADVVATNAGGRFDDKARRLIAKALTADPDNIMALWLAGNAAFEGGDSQAAVAAWRKLLALLPPDSSDAQELRSAIVQAGGAVPAAAVGPVADAASPNASITGTVELDPKLKAAPGDVVMVIARVPGERMPVAVMRASAGQFPLAFTLDDSLAMSPQARISSAKEVEVQARVSRTGDARPRAGDLSSDVRTVKVGARGVSLRVANVKG